MRIEIDLNKDLRKKFLSRTVWCASSTHDTEENFCAQVHKRLKFKYKDLLTVIIPRHIDRIKKIKNEMENMNLNVHIHSSKNKIDKNTDIGAINSASRPKNTIVG